MTMKIKLLVDILFEYGGMRKTLFKAGAIFNAIHSYRWVIKNGFHEETDEPNGYWIGDERMATKPPLENPGTLIRTKCFLNECEVVE
jgi:hypothetical protein